MARSKKVRFCVGRIEEDIPPGCPSLRRIIDQLKSVLKGLTYEGQTRKSNSTQLDIFFDEALFEALDSHEWLHQKAPIIDKKVWERGGGKQKADAILSMGGPGTPKTVLEIEKSNKKTIWMDFIKIWMFMDTKQASLGILLCPLNYAHKIGVWDLFQEAVQYKRFLCQFGRVPVDRFNKLGIVGFEQLINFRGRVEKWDKKHVLGIKEYD